MVYVFLADGFEEIEGLTVVDLLRRAEIEVRTVSIMGRTKICSSHGVTVEADMLIEDIEPKAEMLVLPGGLPGTTNLKEHPVLQAYLKEQYESERWIAAICAAPSVFAEMGFLLGRNATSYPGFVKDDQCAAYLQQEVVVDGHVITSRGMGTAIPFGLKIIEELKDKETAQKVGEAIIYRM